MKEKLRGLKDIGEESDGYVERFNMESRLMMELRRNHEKMKNTHMRESWN